MVGAEGVEPSSGGSKPPVTHHVRPIEELKRGPCPLLLASKRCFVRLRGGSSPEHGMPCLFNPW